MRGGALDLVAIANRTVDNVNLSLTYTCAYVMDAFAWVDEHDELGLDAFVPPPCFVATLVKKIGGENALRKLMSECLAGGESELEAHGDVKRLVKELQSAAADASAAASRGASSSSFSERAVLNSVRSRWADRKRNRLDVTSFWENDEDDLPCAVPETFASSVAARLGGAMSVESAEKLFKRALGACPAHILCVHILRALCDCARTKRSSQTRIERLADYFVRTALTVPEAALQLDLFQALCEALHEERVWRAMAQRADGALWFKRTLWRSHARREFVAYLRDSNFASMLRRHRNKDFGLDKESKTMRSSEKKSKGSAALATHLLHAIAALRGIEND